MKFIKSLLGLILVLFWGIGMAGDKLELSVLNDGEILVNGNTSSLEELSKILNDSKPVVWYYRESQELEPHENATKAIQLIIDKQLPVSLSTEPDFSTVVDENGAVRKR